MEEGREDSQAQHLQPVISLSFSPLAELLSVAGMPGSSSGDKVALPYLAQPHVWEAFGGTL